MSESPYILHFEDCGFCHQDRIGGKCASLGELTKAGLRVPPGFAVTTDAYKAFVKGRRILDEITRLLDGADSEDIAYLEQASRSIRQLIGSTPIPEDVEQAIRDAYCALCAECSCDDLPVAVRSSATAEDLPGASFAGQQDTYLWVRSGGPVVVKTVACWSSLFTPRAIAYRAEMGFPHDQVFISVGVQKMVNPKAAGVMFTLNPINGDRSKIAIEANWGLGESVVAGEVTPDQFLVDKVALCVLKRTISPKLMEYVVDPRTNSVVRATVPGERQTAPCLTDEEVLELTRLGKGIERYYGQPQDIEWAIDRDLPFPENVMILQSRPETVWSQKKREPVAEPGKSVLDHILANVMAGRKLR